MFGWRVFFELHFGESHFKKKSLRGGLRVFEILSVYHQSHVPRDVLIWITLPCEF